MNPRQGRGPWDQVTALTTRGTKPLNMINGVINWDVQKSVPTMRVQPYLSSIVRDVQIIFLPFKVNTTFLVS